MRTAWSRPARRFAAPALCVLLALAAASCPLQKTQHIAPLELAPGPTGTDLVVTAKFAGPEDGVPRFFTAVMADSGIVAVRVALRNDGARTLLVHSPNGMKIAPGFEGFALSAGGASYPPLHPKAVVARLSGAARTEAYRRHGVVAFAASTFVAPLGLYWAYGEADIGRYYRPLFNRSLYPAREDGLLEPVKLAPAGTREGYLYFALPKDAPRDSCELLARGCVAQAVEDRLAGSGFVFSRDELPYSESALVAGAQPEEPRASSASCDAPYGYLFAVGRAPGAKEVDLTFARIRSLNPKSDSLWSRVTGIASEGATIADASCYGSLAAVAVNFRKASKVYLLSCVDRPEVVSEHRFPGAVKHVFMNAGGIDVVSENGTCYIYNGASGAWRRAGKLGTEIDETAAVGDRLFSFLKKKELLVFSAPQEGPLVSAERHPLKTRVERTIGLLDGDLVLLDVTRPTRGDAVSLLRIEPRVEIAHAVFAGKIAAAATVNPGRASTAPAEPAAATAPAVASLVAQLGDGTVLRVARGPRGTFEIAEAGWLPFTATAIKAAPHGFIAIGAAGEIVVGSIESWTPGVAGAVEVSTRVR